MNIISPHTTPVFECIAASGRCDLLVVYESAGEPNRRWADERQLEFPHVVLSSRTLDLRRFVSDAFVHVPREPLITLRRFRPSAVVAAGGGVWSSPTNIAALVGRQMYGWAFIPRWGSWPRSRPSLPRKLAEPWVRRFVRAGDAWVAYGTRARQELLRLGADPARTVVSPLVARPPGTTPRKTRREPGSPPRFLFVGQLIERKGIKLLLEAFAHLEEGELRLAGTGPLRDYVAAAARADSRIVPLGHLGWSELEAEYDAADAVVLPSLYEVWGLVVNEALARGRPVIASDQVGAIDDLVLPGVNGIVFESGSLPSLSRALREAATWTAAQREHCEVVALSKLADWSVERAAQAYVQASLLAVEQRRR